MSQENVEIVKEAIAALNERDLDRYLACCAEDIQLLLPTAPIEGAYEGAAGVQPSKPPGCRSRRELTAKG